MGRALDCQRMDLRQELLNIVTSLEQAGVDYAICGGFAVAIHGYPRLTTDIDLLIRSEDLDAARSALATAGFSLDSGLITFSSGKPDEHSLWRVSRVEGTDLITVDLLMVSDFLQPVWETRERFLLGTQRVIAVSRSGLLRMKQAAGRRKDLDDIERLGLLGDGGQEPKP